MNKIRFMTIALFIIVSALLATSCAKGNVDKETDRADTTVQSTEPATAPETKPEPNAKLDSFLAEATQLFDSSFTDIFGEDADPGDYQRSGSGSLGYVKQASPVVCVYFGVMDVNEIPADACPIYMDCGVDNIFEGQDKASMADLHKMFGFSNVKAESNSIYGDVACVSYGGYSLIFIRNDDGVSFSEFSLLKENQ